MWNEIKESAELRLTEEDIIQKYKNVRIRQGRNSRQGQRKSIQQVNNKQQQKIPIDPNHKYFLIIDDEDDGSEALDGWAGYHFRRDFQNYILSNGARRSFDENGNQDQNDDGRVQTVGVIFNGRLGSLLAVKEMLIERIPIVVIAESGGVADFIKYGIEFLKEEGARDETVTNSDLEHSNVLLAISKIDTQKVQEWLHKVNLKTKNSDETRQWKDNLQLILCQQDLCNVFYHNGKETLQTSILGALMNNLTKNDLVDQLHLAMKLNQV